MFGLREQRFDFAQVKQGVALVGLLDDAGDDVTLAPRVFLVFHLALGLADPLQDHLLGRLRGDATEVLRRVVPFLDHVTVFIQLLRDHIDLAGLDVDLDERFLGGIGHALVSGDQRIGQRFQHDLDRDPLLALNRVERFHHVAIHGRSTP